MIFIVKNEHISYLTHLLLETVIPHCENNFPVASDSHIQMSKGFSDKNFTILSCYWSLNHVQDNDKMNNLHNQLLDLSEKVRNYNGT